MPGKRLLKRLISGAAGQFGYGLQRIAPRLPVHIDHPRPAAIMMQKITTVDRKDIKHQAGHSFWLDLRGIPTGDSAERPGNSLLRVFEDDIELGPCHASHDQIAGIGHGRFSHWSNYLFFSSSDGTSPESNGRRYQVLWDDTRSYTDGLPLSSLPLRVLLNLQRGIMSYQYKGIDCFKCPFDFALYQRLIWDTKPRTIIEIGTWKGGSALWFADLLSTYGIEGHIHSFDIAAAPGWSDNRITFHQADAHSIAAAAPPEWVNTLARPLLVIEDAGHACSMTSAVLKHFGSLMESGEYIIVEDSIIHEMNLDEQYGGGPRRAIREFLHGNAEFVIDRDYCDYYGENVTWNVNGYLRRL